jgi:hypothetical protein
LFQSCQLCTFMGQGVFPPGPGPWAKRRQVHFTAGFALLTNATV